MEIIWDIWFRSVTWLPQYPVTVTSFPFSQNNIVLCDPHALTCNNVDNNLSYFVYMLYTKIMWSFDFVWDLGHQVELQYLRPSCQTFRGNLLTLQPQRVFSLACLNCTDFSTLSFLRLRWKVLFPISFCSCCFFYCKDQSLIISTAWF